MNGKYLLVIILYLICCFQPLTFGAFYDAELTHVCGGSFEYSCLDNRDAETWSKTEYSTNDLRDGNLTTGLRVAGNEPSDQYPSDFGAFILLEFKTDIKASEVFFDIHARSFGGHVANSLYMMAQTSYVYGWNYHIAPKDNEIYRIYGSFDATGNTFTSPDPEENRWYTIDSIRLPDNRFRVLVSGPFWWGSTINDMSPPQGIEVFEAKAFYTPVPEPATFCLIALGSLALIRTKTIFH